MDENLKKELLGVAEEHLVLIIDQAESIGKTLAASSANTIDDVAMSVFGLIKAELKKQVDKIDGEVG